jgi:hypothetical protein
MSIQHNRSAFGRSDVGEEGPDQAISLFLIAKVLPPGIFGQDLLVTPLLYTD